ncbi:MAG: glycoside hydrolase family 3 protein, partial [Phycisphaerae bacterium]
MWFKTSRLARMSVACFSAVLMTGGWVRAGSAALPTMVAAIGPGTMTPAQAARGPAVEARVKSLLGKLTLAEKIRLLSGYRYMYTYPIPRLGIPAVKMSDGRVAVNHWGPDTLFPATISLVAGWDRKLCYKEGIAMGRDARARGVNIVLSPLVNLYREPQDGRNYEYMGEDPYLASHVAVPYIRGMQSQHVAADVTDFCAYEQEINRTMIDSIVSHRALEELYFPPFKAAVQRAGVWTLMSSYNRMNHEWCSADRYLLTDVLRHRWHFKGLVMCDWVLNSHISTLHALWAGLNLEMPSGVDYTAQRIMPLIRSGDFRLARLNALVTPLLRMIVAMDISKYSKNDPSIAMDDPYSAHIAYKIEKQGAVLLRNKNNLLPLTAGSDHLIVVVGPNARSVAPGGGSPFEGGGSSYD